MNWKASPIQFLAKDTCQGCRGTAKGQAAAEVHSHVTFWALDILQSPPLLAPNLFQPGRETELCHLSPKLEDEQPK